MDKRRGHSAQRQPTHFQTGRRHHPYSNQHLPFKRVYKFRTFTEAESASSNRELHHPGSRRRKYDIQFHKPDIKQEPSTSIGDNFYLRKHILKMMITDLQTPRLVEEAGFHHFMKVLNPSTDAVLSASAIQHELVNMYDITKKKVKNAVINATHPVLSAELWILSEEESYLTVTCHFIDKKWELKSYTLDTAQLLGEHTPENVHRQLWRISREWEITDKIQVVVINVDGMKKINPKPNWMYIPCFSHTLNKVLRDVVNDTDWRYLLKKCRKIVQFFHHENEASWRHCLAQSSCVDWVATLNMVKKVCQQWPSFSQVNNYKRADNLWLNENERMLLENMKKALTVVKDVTEATGTRGYVSISNLIPLHDKLQLNLRRLIQQKNKVALKLSEQCKHHFENIKQHMWCTLSTALDPRFKSIVLKSHGGESVKMQIIDEMRKQASGTTSISSHKNSLGEMDYEDLVLQYATEGDISATQSPLQYWAAKNKSKDLAMVAHKYLSVISTAVPIEQMMQEDKSQIIFNRRKCLEIKDINMMLFLHGNHQNI
ncbi:E3 SUMO-protein ligase ZBED1 isoform X2 [Neoarius graeffei]|uniref:E3 SUMO-protein ligase ZBED1 isoform X2 n=1 Tax=Neoarius graeffei TaxID=443677 RepID=UPI00298D3622|nr:E3 SUMO-protein ligase ZBED1 isoform X2 [Neoarius graeffei]